MVNGKRQQGDAPTESASDAAERVTEYQFNAKQWDMVCTLATHLLDSTQRSFVEHFSRYHTRAGFEKGDFVGVVASLAANQALATASHMVAHQVTEFAAIEAREKLEQDERRRRSQGFTEAPSASANEGDANGPAEGDSGSRIEIP